MAKAKQKSVASIKTKRLKSEQSHLHFAMTAKNYSIIGLGIIEITEHVIAKDETKTVQKTVSSNVKAG